MPFFYDAALYSPGRIRARRRLSGGGQIRLRTLWQRRGLRVQPLLPMSLTDNSKRAQQVDEYDEHDHREQPLEEGAFRRNSRGGGGLYDHQPKCEELQDRYVEVCTNSGKNEWREAKVEQA